MEEAEFCDRIALIHQGKIRAIDTPHGLKEMFLKEIGHVFDVPLKDIEPFVKEAKNLPVIKDILPHGAHLHLITSPSLTKEGLKRILTEKFGTIAEKIEPTPVMPTLEDVFIGLLREPLKV